MQKIFREIIEELKKKAHVEGEKCAEWVKREDADNVARYNHGEYCYLDSIHTVERFMKLYGAEWIPCDERYPDTDEYILISFEVNNCILYPLNHNIHKGMDSLKLQT